jgi:DNA-directed RNA polymerase subunit RPC12/RpoP
MNIDKNIVKENDMLEEKMESFFCIKCSNIFTAKEHGWKECPECSSTTFVSNKTPYSKELCAFLGFPMESIFSDDKLKQKKDNESWELFRELTFKPFPTEDSYGK